MINGTEYAFEDIQVSVFGISIQGFTNVRYGVQKDHNNIHARGNKPHSMGRGKKDSTPGLLTILQSEFERLNKATPPGKDPTDWPAFPMVVSYAPEGGTPVTDLVPFCRVNNWEKGMSTEDGEMTIDLNLTTGIPQLNI